MRDYLFRLSYKRVFLAILFLISFFSSPPALAQKENKADSIMRQLINHRELYGNYIQSYDAAIYIKGNSHVKKKNFLYRYAPNFLYWDRKGGDTFVEAFLDTRFESPNNYSQHIIAVNGSRLSIHDLQQRVMQFLNINIYNPTIFDGQVFLPDKNIEKYYQFEYVNSYDTLGHEMHKIKVIPVIKSQKLISGELKIIDGLWTIFSFDMRGKSEFSKFGIEVEFGLPEEDFLLPKKMNITFSMKILGNEVVNHYFSSYNYISVVKYQHAEERKSLSYDLSKYYSIHIDSIPIVRDSLFWKNNRPIALSPHEEELHQKAIQIRKDTDSLLVNKSWNFSQGLIAPKRFAYNSTLFTYSGLLNPLKLSYSKSDGIRYWQQLRLVKRFSNGEELRFNPNVGYLFKRKEFYFNTPIRWVYRPERLGELSFNFGNKNRTYSSAIIKQIEKEIPDSINFEDFNLAYYRHYQMSLMSSYEITNGLLISGGVNYDWYNPVKGDDKKGDNQRVSQSPLSAIGNDDITDIVSDRYKSFAPTIEITYTPKQYYRMNGRKKEYIGSRWPTISISYARGIKGIVKSNSDYERIEIDIQQRIPIGVLNSFQYYIGAGGFTNKESTYFANYSFFQRNNFPRSWNDPIGGVFHLLGRDWYFASNSYVQAHFMYESPFALLWLFRNVTKDILTERFYLSQLYTPVLPCYTEVGYGVGNFIGNIGIFASFNKGKYESFGVKASFELGR